jgi:hypothetical protein
LIGEQQLKTKAQIDKPSAAAQKAMRRNTRKASKARFERQSRPTIAQVEKRKEKRAMRLYCVRPKKVA